MSNSFSLSLLYEKKIRLKKTIDFAKSLFTFFQKVIKATRLVEIFN